MKIRLPVEERWSSGYQQRINGQIEQALDRIREYAIPPAGGVAGQVLTKNTDRDYDFAWLDPGAITANYLKRTTGEWQTSTDGVARFNFSDGGRTYFGSQNGYEWRNTADAAVMELANDSTLTLTAANSTPWAISLARADLGTSSKVFMHPYDGTNLGWAFQHMPYVAGVREFGGGVGQLTFPVSNGSVYQLQYTSNSATATALRLFTSDGTSRTFLYADNGGNYGILDGAGNWALQLTASIANFVSRTIQTTEDVYAGGGFRWKNDTSFYLYNPTGYTYGSWRVGGANGGYCGLILDTGNHPTFMSSGANEVGVYLQGSSYWSWYDSGTTFDVQNPIRTSAGLAYLKHATAGHGSGEVTVSTSAPSGGSDGDIWLKV